MDTNFLLILYALTYSGIQKHNFSCADASCYLTYIQMAVNLALFRNIFMRRSTYRKTNIWVARSTEKIDTLNKRILRFILQDYNPPYDSLLSKVNCKSLYKRRPQTLYKSLFFTCYPGYLRNMFSLRSVSYSLRGNYALSLLSTKSTTYGLHSFSYMASKLCNSLPDCFRMSDCLD